MEKNITCISGEQKIFPENESFSPVSDKLSLEENRSLIMNTNDSGDIGDRLDYTMEYKNNFSNNSNNNTNIKCIHYPKPSDTRIRHSHPFYYCKEHPKIQNINL